MRIGALEVVVLAVLAVIAVLAVVVRRNRRAIERRIEERPSERRPDELSAFAPPARSTAWAYGVLFEAGVDPDADPPYAAKLLREADPTLGDAQARALIARMVAD